MYKDCQDLLITYENLQSSSVDQTDVAVKQLLLQMKQHRHAQIWTRLCWWHESAGQDILLEVQGFDPRADPFVACGMRQLADPIYNALLFFFARDAANWGEIFAFRNTSCFWPPLLSSCCTIKNTFSSILNWWNLVSWFYYAWQTNIAFSMEQFSLYLLRLRTWQLKSICKCSPFITSSSEFLFLPWTQKLHQTILIDERFSKSWYRLEVSPMLY